MKMQAFRVREVMAGHSSTAAVVAEDAQGRQVRLEVGALEGASIRAGELLVLSWATVAVPPELGLGAQAGEVADEDDVEPVLGRAVEELEIVSPEEAATEEPTTLEEFKALIGLR
jgi:hypothetical protein